MTSGRCYTTGANVIALCILLITMADIIAIIGADVIATEADVIAYHICISWLMLLPRRWQMLLPLRLMLLPTISILLG